jgi:shikimate dehydrogenase
MKIPLVAVIGHPVGHSRSPRLHGHWLRRHGIAGHYVPLDISPADLKNALEMLPRLGFVGANVTIPHKEVVLSIADTATALARRIGAANTLVFRDGQIEADNTDAYGFAANILDHAPGWQPRCVSVIGAGGASRAVIAALQDHGATEIRITNRTDERARALAAEFGLNAHAWENRHAMLEGCDTLINTTSLGMNGQPPLELRLEALSVDAVVNDLVYAPLETELLQEARLRGNRCVDGLGMLLHQAAPGFERWFHVKPSVDADLRAAVLA